MKRTLVLVLGLVLLSATPLPTASGDDPAPAKPSVPLRDVELPVGRPADLDGHVRPAEWAAGVARPLGTSGGLLRFQQSPGVLLVALDVPRPWPVGAHLWLLACPDVPEGGLHHPQATRLDYEPHEHDRPHLDVTRQSGPVGVRVEGRAVARATVRGPRTQVELAVKTDLLGVDAKAPAPLRVAVLWTQPNGATTHTWPPHLLIEAAPGGTAPDLVSSARWGRLLGWQPAADESAYSDTTWNALIDADRELARRGREAHAFGLLIGEEPETRKADTDQEPEVIANLAWIAEREPLTPNDLLLLARAYRFWNRAAESLATLDALRAFPAWWNTDRLFYECALTLRAASRYGDAAAVWERLAARSDASLRPRYEETAVRDRQRQQAWDTEQAARREDEALDSLPIVEIRTSRGAFRLLLHARDVPEAAQHFLDLVELDVDGRRLYAGTLFHRVIGGFLAQGGDPSTRDGDCAAGGPGDGPWSVGVEQNERHGFWRGSVGYARGPEYSNGCQFFVLVAARPALEHADLTCFGHIVEGQDVVDRLELCDPILDVRIVRRGAPIELPDPMDAEPETAE